MRTTMKYVGLAALGVLLAACTNQKEPAEKAFTQIQSTLTEIRADAEKYAPEDLKNVDASFAHLKSNLDKQDYAGVKIAAPSVASAVNALKETVTLKKAEAAEILATAQSEWNEISAAVPGLVSDLQNRMDAFARSRRLPKDFSQHDFMLAKATLDDIKKVWTEASAEYAEGKVGEAVRKGRVVKMNAEYLLQRISA